MKKKYIYIYMKKLIKRFDLLEDKNAASQLDHDLHNS